MIFQAKICCPVCGFEKIESMPENTYQSQYTCTQCKTVLKTKKGECCVFCSYAYYPCPLTQISGSSCCSDD